MTTEGTELFYHVCTDGLSRSILFRDRYDYIDGMNDIPICAIAEAIKVYCFCLMSNHVHFILKGDESRCISFLRKYKRLRSLRNRSRYGTECKIAGPSDISVKKIEDAEYRLTAMAYVMRNPLAAGIQVMPCQYPWSSSSLYFSYRSDIVHGYGRLSELGKVQACRVLKTRTKLPDSYLIREDGLIWPGCYVEYKAAERLFGSPRRLLYYLSRNLDMENELDGGIIAKARYSDTELAVSAESVCFARFHQKDPHALTIENRYQLARELHRRYGASARQIARVIGMDAQILGKLL